MFPTFPPFAECCESHISAEPREPVRTLHKYLWNCSGTVPETPPIYNGFLYKRPSNSDSLYLPYDSQIDQDRYETSYNASLNDDGTIDYTGKAPDDFYVWDNNDIIYSSSSGVIGGSSSGSSNDGTFKSFASSFNGFFKFISYLFNYLPVGIKNLFLCGFTGIIVIAFVKKVF